MSNQKTTISFKKIKGTNYEVELKGKPKGISGHRFVSLLGISSYSNDKLLLLDFYGLKYTPPTKNIRLGLMLEPTCQQYAYGQYNYITFSNEQTKGNVFGKDEDEISGVPDTLIPELEMLNENKITTLNHNGVKKEWEKQLQFYAYWWNKKRKEDTGIEIKKLEITKYYIPETLVDWHLNNTDKIIEANFYKQEIPLDTEQIEKDMVYVREKRLELLKGGIRININKCKFFEDGLVKGLLDNSIRFKYDKKDVELDKLISRVRYTAKNIKKERENR